MAEHCNWLVMLLVAFAQANFASSQLARKMFSSNGYRHIWSRCDRLDRDFTGCTQNQPMTCASRQSPGPLDADVEIQLAGLPASAYLHFWAPRKYAPYKPLQSPVGCMVYRNILEAHPKYWDSDFNGGNVRISASGEAVIRVRAPSTYFVWKYIAIPHIRLRLCQPNVIVKNKPPDATLYFGLNETWVQSDPSAHSIRVSTAAPFAARAAHHEPKPGGPEPFAKIVGVRTHTPVATLPLADREALINAAKDALSLAALEYSPVYMCFLFGLFYDHFSEDCIQQCPETSEPVHGQCSRIASETTNATITAVWKLDVSCGLPDECLPDSNRTLHMARLAVASHLAIPFQEVRVGISFTESSSRRLLELRQIYFKATVNTRRMKQVHGERLLDMLIADVEFARELLGVDIRRIEILGDVPSQQRIIEMNELNDPYSPAYEAARPMSQKKKSDNIFGVFSHAEFFGIVGGLAVFLTGLCILLCLWRRGKARKARETLAQERAQEKVNSIEENGKEKASSDAEADKDAEAPNSGNPDQLRV